MTSDFAEYVEWLLDRFQTAPRGMLKHFQDIEPLTLEYMASDCFDVGKIESLRALDRVNVDRADVDRRIDVVTLGGIRDDSRLDEIDDDQEAICPPHVAEDLWETLLARDRVGFHMLRIREVSARACRGVARLAFPHMVEANFVVTEKNGRQWGSLVHYFGQQDQRWHYAGTAGVGYRPNEPFYARAPIPQIKFAYRIAFARRYDWRVSLGHVDGPTISFVTDPVGAREVFRLRDMPNGKHRRAALKHWVTEHWRKRRDDPGESIKVRKHIRGAERFTWNGLACRIAPSQFDLERASRP